MAYVGSRELGAGCGGGALAVARRRGVVRFTTGVVDLRLDLALVSIFGLVVPLQSFIDISFLAH